MQRGIIRSSISGRGLLAFLALLCSFSLWNNFRVGTIVVLTVENQNQDEPLREPIEGTGTFHDGSTSDKDALALEPLYEVKSRHHSVWKYPLASPKNTSSSNTPHLRAIALLSMGPSAAESTLVERCIISIRKLGQFFDPVILLTYSPLERYDSLTSQDFNVVVMHPLRSDWNWELRRDLPYKRFKTYLLDYLKRDERLDSVRLVYYLDIDIVIGQPLLPWFHHVEQTYLSSHTNVPSSSATMVMFDGNISPLQGGQFLVQKGHSESCLERWRYHMDAHPKEHKDQPSLTLMWEEQQGTKANVAVSSKTNTHNCTLIRMPQQPYLEFLSVKEMSQLKGAAAASAALGGSSLLLSSSKQYPTLMHIKNTQHASMIPDQLQKEFFQQLLELPPEMVVNITGCRRIRPNRTWSALQVLNQ
jgi:hypothetical protein